MTYYNTTSVIGDELREYIDKTEKQKDKVLDLFQRYPAVEITAEDVQRLVLENAPITSARRAITDLYDQGHLEKVGQVKGRYGRPIFKWRYVGK